MGRIIEKEKVLEGLNEKQKEAVLHTEGPILIVAGAGSGKTKTLTHRLAYLLAIGVRPEEILALTFTNKAAEEMRERVKKLVAYKINFQKIFIGTFHKLGVKILREIYPLANRKKNFVIFDEEDTANLIRQCLKELDLPPEQFNVSLVKEEISRAKNELLNFQDYERKVLNYFQEKVAKVYKLYDEKLQLNNAFDFDDLIKIPVEIFKKFPGILEKYQKRWRYILVDEYQDTNTAQYLLTKLLASYYRNLCVVGDEDQSIYSWRQADFRNFLNFEKDWPEAKIIILEKSYRLTKNILKAAQELIRNNQWRREKILVTDNPDGSPIFLVKAQDEIEEAEFVVGMIDYLIKTYHYQPKDFTVLYRINAQSRVLEEAFLKAGLPYQIFGGIKFYQRKEIKDLLAYLRILINPFDKLSLERIINIPPRKIGLRRMKEILSSWPVQKKLEKFPQILEFLKFLEELREFSKKYPVSETLKFLIEKIAYKTYLLNFDEKGQERWQNVLELLRLAETFDHYQEKSLEKFLEEITLFQEGDEKKNRKNAVQLMTLHSAKGLEFNVVFIVGLEEGILPHLQSQFSQEELEEERRLTYVGLTRAKREVYLVWSLRRRLFGNLTFNPPSRFLEELPKEVIQEIMLEDFEEDQSLIQNNED